MKNFDDLELDTQSAKHFRINKLKQVTLACQLCLVNVGVHMAYVGKYDTVIILAFNMLMIFVSYLIAKKHSIPIGSGIFLVFISVCCCYLMWKNEGLTDETITLIPGILIFSSVVSSFKLTVTLLTLFSINILTLGYVNDSGLYINESNKSSLEVALLLTFIIILITFSVSLVSRDLSRLLVKLERENVKVKESRKEIIRLQNHDPLTGLPNRVLSQQVFDRSAKLSQRENFATSLMFIDIDSFKTINDTLGHAAGDTYLIEIAKRLSTQIRESDSVFRMGGDEFVVVAHHKQPENSALVLANKLLRVFEQKISLHGIDVILSASIGIAMAPQDGISFDELSKKADLAMYEAKNSGRNCALFYQDDMSQDNSRMLKIVRCLRQAIEQKEFELLYQSKHCLKHNKVVAAEALLRWNNPELGEVLPTEFIPIAEKSGAISAIGKWVLNEAVRQCKQWHKQGLTIDLSINVSSAQFRRTNFARTVAEALDLHGLDGKHLILEITESMLFEVTHELESSMTQIASYGVKYSIDDFGTGYSNLGYLNKFDAYSLKIDRSFVSNMHESKQDFAIIEAIVGMAKKLDIQVVAEGIETKTQLQTVKNLNCDLAQGYFFSRPISAKEFFDLAKTS